VLEAMVGGGSWIIGEAKAADDRKRTSNNPITAEFFRLTSENKENPRLLLMD
jgi:hypothetical protein